MKKLAYTLLWVGGINWGLIGLFGYNLVDAILGQWPGLVQIIYILVGLAALYSISKDGAMLKKK